jgi:hypothetical protein
MPDEYISCEAALKYIKSEQCRTCSDIGMCGNCAVLVAVKLLEKVPAADVAEVVRCKDCIYRIEGRCFSRMSFLNAPAVEPDNFCSWGATE